MCQEAEGNALLLIWKPAQEMPGHLVNYPRPLLFISAMLLFKNNISLTLKSPHNVMKRIWALEPGRFSSLSWPCYFLPAGGWELLKISECFRIYEMATVYLPQEIIVKRQKITYVKGLLQCLPCMHLQTFTEPPLEDRHVPDTGGGGEVQSQLRHGPYSLGQSTSAPFFCHPSCSLHSLYHKAEKCFQPLFSFDSRNSLMRQMKLYPVCKWEDYSLKEWGSHS